MMNGAREHALHAVPWVGSRPPSTMAALAPDGLRVVFGLLLVLHYGRCARLPPALLSGPAWSRSAYPLAPLSRLAACLPARGLVLWFDLGVVLGALVVLGIAPRACAALIFAMSSATYAVLAATQLDDAFAQVFALWVVLLPVGHTLALPRVGGWRGWKRCSVSTWPLLAAAAVLQLLLLELAAPGGPLAPSARLGFFLSAAASVAPFGGLRSVAVLPALVGLSVLGRDPGARLASIGSAALCLVLFLDSVRRRPDDPDRAGRSAEPLGVGAAVGFSLALLLAVQLLAEYGRAPRVARAAENAFVAVAWQRIPQGGNR
ncbi:MAG TPA: hypothetical protein VKU41_02385 [Polyangiaceae bacterium]|nr:hypothetical protein [Polyangiaceae bacterium]